MLLQKYEGNTLGKKVKFFTELLQSKHSLYRILDHLPGKNTVYKQCYIIFILGYQQVVLLYSILITKRIHLDGIGLDRIGYLCLK